MYHGAEHILHLEFQTGFDRQLVARLLIYNAGLYHDHHLPVITIVMYPFRVKKAVSPLSIKSIEEEILTFHFKTLALFELDAEGCPLMFCNESSMSLTEEKESGKIHQGLRARKKGCASRLQNVLCHRALVQGCCCISDASR